MATPDELEQQASPTLDTRIQRLRAKPDALEQWLREEVPAWQRLSVRLALCRQLGIPRARALWLRCVGAEPPGFATRDHAADGATLDEPVRAIPSFGPFRQQAIGELQVALHRTPRGTEPGFVDRVVGRLAASSRPHFAVDEWTATAFALAPVVARRAATLYRRASKANARLDASSAQLVSDALANTAVGQPLPEELRRDLESELGVRFDNVRIHLDTKANAAARAIHARAFTVGQDIFFAEGSYAPHSAEGRRLIAHELSHVVQAYEGRIRRGGAGLAISDEADPLEHEAESVAGRFAARSTASAADEPRSVGAPPAVPRASGEAPVVHRSPDPSPSSDGPDASPSQPPNDAAASSSAGPSAGARSSVASSSSSSSSSDATPNVAPGTPPTPSPSPNPPSPAGSASATPSATSSAAPSSLTSTSAGSAQAGLTASDGARGTPADLPPLPDLSHSPEAAASAQTIVQRAADEQAALRQRGSDERARLDARSQAIVADLRAQAQQRATAFVASVTAQREAVSATIVTARVAANASADAQRDGLAKESQRSANALWQIVANQQQAALAAAGAETGLVMRAAHAAAERARKSAADQAKRVRMTAQQKAAAFTSTEEKGTKAGRDAVLQIAAETSQQIEDNGNELATNTVASSQKLADAINDEARQLEQALGDGVTEQQKTIDRAAEATRRRIDQLLAAQLTQLDTLESDTLAAIDSYATAMLAQLQQRADDAATRAQDAARQASDRIGDAVDDNAQQLDRAARTAVGKLGDIARRGKIQASVLASAVAGVEQQMAKTRDEAERAIATLVDTTADRNALAEADVLAALDDAVAAATAKMTECAAAVGDATTQLQTQTTQQMQEATAAQAALDAQIEQKLDDDLGKKVDSADQSWVHQRQHWQDDANQRVDEAISDHQQTADRAIGKMDETARDAAHDAESIWSAIGHALWSFVKGVLTFIIVLAVVALVIVIVVALAEVELGILAILALALEITGCIMLAYGLVMNFERRWAELMSIPGAKDMPWYMKALAAVGIAGIAVADTFGFGALFEAITGHDLVTGEKLSAAERWGRFTEAVLTFLTLGLLKGLMGKLGKAAGNEGPSASEGDTPEADPASKPPAGMSDWLVAKRASLSDPRAIEQFDRMYERMRGNSEKMQRAIENMEANGSLQDKLIDQWQRDNPTPPDDATVKRLDALIDRAQQLKQRIDEYRAAHQSAKVNELSKTVNGVIKKLTDMRNDFAEYDYQKMLDQENNLKGAEHELDVASQPGNEGGLGRKVLTADGGIVDIDITSTDGKTWTEAKNKTPFSTGSETWKSEIEPQAQKIKAAAENPANWVDGQPPRRVYNFKNPIGSDVAQALRAMGFEVVTPAEVDPSTLAPPSKVPPVVPNTPDDKHEGN